MFPNRMFRSFLALIALSLALLFVLRRPNPIFVEEIMAKDLAKHQAESAVENDTPFSGKALVIKLSNSLQTLAVIDQVRLRKIGDRSFIVGRALDVGDKSWFRNRVVFYPFDALEVIAEFDNIEQVKNAQPEGFFYSPLPPPTDKASPPEFDYNSGAIPPRRILTPQRKSK